MSELNDGVVYQYMDNGPAGLWQDCSHSVYLCQESDERRILYTSPLASLSDDEWYELALKIIQFLPRARAKSDIPFAARKWLEGRKG